MEIINFLLILITSMLFGFFLDLADLTDEHGLKLFKGDKYIFGILSGIFGALTIFLNIFAAVYVLSLVVYWLLIGKVDYVNHLISFVIIIASGLYFYWQDNIALFNFLYSLGLLLTFYFLQKILIKKLGLKYRKKTFYLARHIIAPFVVSILLFNSLPLIVATMIIIGVWISTYFFDKEQEVWI